MEERHPDTVVAGPPFRPEVALLLCCARLHVSPAQRDRIEDLIHGDLDWACLVTLASRHGLLPLLYRTLNSLTPGTVPRAILVELWMSSEFAARRGRVMARELSAILELLDTNGIPAIPFKGPALAAAVYGDLGLRECGDLDLLVQRQDLIQAKRLLESRGYVPEYGLTPALEAAFLRSHLQYHLTMVHPTQGILVELHWKTDADFPVEPEGDPLWWTTAPRVTFDAARIRCFTTEELLLVLCVHGSKHSWGSLGWLVDVSELIRQHPDIDWGWLIATAGRLGCTRRMAVGVHLADRLLDVPLPTGVRRTIESVAGLKKLADGVLATLFDEEPGRAGAFRALVLKLNLLYERRWPQLRHFLYMVLAPTSNDWLRWPLPQPLYFLYVPLRLSRLIAKHGSALFASR